MGVNSLPKTVTRQHRDCDLNTGPSAPESSTLTTRLPSHPGTVQIGLSLSSSLLDQLQNSKLTLLAGTTCPLVKVENLTVCVSSVRLSVCASGR